VILIGYLVEITTSNWRECCDLSVSPEQKGFIASKQYSLAESKFEPSFYPIGIEKDNKLIGFAMRLVFPQAATLLLCGIVPLLFRFLL